MITERIPNDSKELILRGLYFSDRCPTKIQLKVILPAKLSDIDKGAFSVNGCTSQITIDKDNFGNLWCNISTVAETKWPEFIPYPLKTRGQVFIKSDDTWIDALDFPEMENINKNWEEYKQNKENAWNKQLQRLSNYGFTDNEINILRRSLTIHEVNDMLRVLDELRRTKPNQQIINSAMKYISRIHFENILKIKIMYIKTAQIAVRKYAKERGFEIDN